MNSLFSFILFPLFSTIEIDVLIERRVVNIEFFIKLGKKIKWDYLNLKHNLWVQCIKNDNYFLSGLGVSTRAMETEKTMRGQDVLPPRVTIRTLNLCSPMHLLTDEWLSGWWLMSWTLENQLCAQFWLKNRNWEICIRQNVLREERWISSSCKCFCLYVCASPWVYDPKFHHDAFPHATIHQI